jgi:hypothetical protein
LQVYEIWSMVGSRGGGMEAVGLAVFADGQALVTALRANPETLTVDYEFTSYEEAAARTVSQVMSFKLTRDSVRSFTELYALATTRYGWSPEADKRWVEREAESEYGKEHAGRALKKPKGFVRA